MTRILESSKYLVWIGVISLAFLTVAAFLWGALKTVGVIRLIVTTMGQDPDIAVSLLQVVDAFLIGIALIVVWVSMYELFLGDLHLPDWMLAHDLHELEGKLSGVIILIMVVKFLEKLIDWRDPLGTLQFAISIGVVSAVLIAMNYLGVRHRQG